MHVEVSSLSKEELLALLKCGKDRFTSRMEGKIISFASHSLFAQQ